MLYNGTYLTKEMSEKALELLSKVDFTGGIRSGLPSDMVVAQKFGERDISTTSGVARAGDIKELHDCGIVYFPDHPYLLCVMTSGNNFDKLSSVLKDVSNVVYQSMSSGLNQ